MEKVRIRKEDLPKVRYILSLREKTKELIFKESGGYSDTALNHIRAGLKSTYDEFVFKYGHILDKNNSRLTDLDADKYVICALENKDKITGRISPSDILEHSFLENKNHVSREVVSPFNDKIGETKELPSGEIAAGLQIKQAILDMPQTMERFIRNIEKEKQDIAEYSKQLNSLFPYKDELHSKKERLIEVDGIIIAKAKEVDESKKAIMSFQNEGEEPKQTQGASRNL